jgi:hypothetical protein
LCIAPAFFSSSRPPFRKEWQLARQTMTKNQRREPVSEVLPGIGLFSAPTPRPHHAPAFSLHEYLSHTPSEQTPSQQVMQIK